MPFQTIYIPGINSNVVVVTPESLQSGTANRRMIRSVKSGRWPAPPPIPFNWSMGASYPMLGNDVNGDCQLVAGVHCDQCMQYSAVGVEPQYTTAAVVADYYSVTGGVDEGWNEINLTYQWEANGLGGNPNAKIWDYLNIDYTNAATLQAATAFFGPTIWNGYLAPSWLASYKTGFTWDIGPGINPDLQMAHAVMLMGFQANGNSIMANWGTEAYFTQRAIVASAFAMFVSFGPRWFNAQGYAPNGLHYTFLAPLWVSLGGLQSQLPLVSPYPPPTPGPPVPPPPPTPPAFVADMALFVGAKQVHIGEAGWSMKDDIPAMFGQTVKFNYGARVVHAPKHWTQTTNVTDYDVGISLPLNQIHAPGWAFSGGGSPGVITAKVGQRTGTMPAGWSQV